MFDKISSLVFQTKFLNISENIKYLDLQFKQNDVYDLENFKNLQVLKILYIEETKYYDNYNYNRNYGSNRDYNNYFLFLPNYLKLRKSNIIQDFKLKIDFIKRNNGESIPLKLNELISIYGYFFPFINKFSIETNNYSFLLLENQSGEYIDNSLEKTEKSFFLRINTLKTNEILEVNLLRKFSNIKSITFINLKITESMVVLLTEFNLVELVFIGLNIDTVEHQKIFWEMLSFLKFLKVLEIDFKNSNLQKNQLLNFLTNNLLNSDLRKVVLKNFDFEFFSYELNLINNIIDQSKIEIFIFSAQENKIKVLKQGVLASQKKIHFIILQEEPSNHLKKIDL